MDVHTVNRMTEKELGYPMCEYWLFFTEDDTGKFLGDHVSCLLFQTINCLAAPFMPKREEN